MTPRLFLLLPVLGVIAVALHASGLAAVVCAVALLILITFLLIGVLATAWGIAAGRIS